jgi:hypothetical protein
MDIKDAITIAVAAGGWVYAGFKEWLSYRERQVTRKEEELFKALSWFEGHTQKRNIGIAIVEGLWAELPDYHKTLIPLLANQAIYLLGASETATPHERNNLERIMQLILRYPSLTADFDYLQGELLSLTSPTSERFRGPTGKSIDAEKLASWHKTLDSISPQHR